MKLKLALPPTSVVTDVDPRNTCPSPLRESSGVVEEKNSKVRDVAGVLLIDPAIAVSAPAGMIEAIVGKF